MTGIKSFSHCLPVPFILLVPVIVNGNWWLGAIGNHRFQWERITRNGPRQNRESDLSPGKDSCHFNSGNGWSKSSLLTGKSKATADTTEYGEVSWLACGNRIARQGSEVLIITQGCRHLFDFSVCHFSSSICRILAKEGRKLIFFLVRKPCCVFWLTLKDNRAKYKYNININKWISAVGGLNKM